ncbi:MAG: hypothetical protein L6427_02445, partial [Actinomycetia bacterium]|nr:hypothetical protein [Actinomycetes bacterium]
AELFKKTDYGGSRLETSSGVADLGAHGFDDAVSSLKFDEPIVRAATPYRGKADTVVNITDLAGERFRSGAWVWLKRKGQQSIYGRSVEVVSPRRITCSFDLTDAETGRWDVVVTNREGQTGTLARGFDVEPADDDDGDVKGHKTWYLAEGSTGSDPACSFETWVLVMNPGSETANVELTYMTENGAVPGPSMELEPGSRRTVNVADVVPDNWSVSTKVVSDQDVIAERSTYWNGRVGGHDSIGLGL